jgi:Mg2+-importing ATPase
MKLVGFLTFTDPPKENVTETLQMLERFGVGLKILTGDNELITKYVCDQLKIEVKGVTVGQEIDKLNDKELTNLVQRTTVFARLNPEQKQKIILALKQSGKVVGYMGDGINDATSLKAADVGISVNNAVDVAKESADLILLHKDLRVLLVGIEAGRTTFANILKYIMMGTSSTFGNMLSLSAASILLPFLPLLPVQVLLNDLVYDISQILIVKDSVDENYILTPRKWSIKFIDKFMVYFGTASSIFDLLTFYVLLHFFRATPDFFQTGWFLESMTTQLLVIFCIRTTMVPFWRSRPNPVFAWGIAGLLAAVLYLPYSPVGGYFHFVPMPLNFYLMMGTISMAYLLLIELIKKNFYKARK